MSEGRKSQVILLDDRKIEFIIQPKLYAVDLLDLVASHFNLKEKEYFGLAFQDDTGHYNWIQLDRKVLDHDIPRKHGTIILHFRIKFFIESIAFLRETTTVEAFYLQAKQSIYKGLVECDSDTAFELAAHVLQATCGDCTDDETAKKDLKKLPVLPVRTLEQHPSLSYCEEQVVIHYKKLAGLSRGSSIVNYMTIVESLPTYGIHYYEVKDKHGMPWWLGLSHKGIAQYDQTDKKIPRRVFAWKQLENLYFRDKKFSIEVHDPKRIVHTLSSFNLYEEAIQEPLDEFDELSDAISDPTTQVSVSKRTFGPSNVNVFAWFAISPPLTKCIWSMAVSQHQFYLDRKQSKTYIPIARSMSEIAAELSQSTPSLYSSSGTDSISHCSSATSLSHCGGSKIDLPRFEGEEMKTANRDMFTALKARKDALEDELRKKTEELKIICLKEASITGELPPELPTIPGEDPPPIRRRVGTAFTLSPKMVYGEGRTEEEEKLAKLELDFELQKQITSAAYRLFKDKKQRKVRRQRKDDYQRAFDKLKDLEQQLNDLRKEQGKDAILQSQFEDRESEGSIGPTDSESDILSLNPSPAIERNAGDETSQLVEREPSTSSSQCSLVDASPSSPSRHAARDVSPNRGFLGYGYQTSSVTRTEYRKQMYPTLSTHSHLYSSGSFQSDYDNVSSHSGGSRGDIHNLYNVNSHRTSRYDSADELKSPQSADEADSLYRQHMCRHGSLDAGVRQLGMEEKFADYSKHYGSLERNFSYSGSTKKSMMDDYRKHGLQTLSYSDSCGSGVGSSIDSMQHQQQQQQQQPQTVDIPKSWYVGQPMPTDSPIYFGHNETVDLSNIEDDSSVDIYDTEQNAVQYPRGQSFTKVTQNPHFREETKPYEMSDFYKYSEKLRRARSVERQRLQPQIDQSPVDRSPITSQCAHSVHYESMSPGLQYATGPVQVGYARAVPLHYAAGEPDYNAGYHGDPQHKQQSYHSPQFAQKLAAFSGQPLTCEPVQEPPKTSSQRLV
ncbi:FERM domain-containing protein 4B-like isoform X2 [Tubulanus polymorphus]|uniref:FERM domain-containing protein 4B-like isoform X2 n=1 Tax=Tubulanus polymorphus TaxID=672921 RepID=UPI003DA4DA74